MNEVLVLGEGMRWRIRRSSERVYKVQMSLGVRRRRLSEGRNWSNFQGGKSVREVRKRGVVVRRCEWIVLELRRAWVGK